MDGAKFWKQADIHYNVAELLFAIGSVKHLDYPPRKFSEIAVERKSMDECFFKQIPQVIAQAMTCQFSDGRST